MYSTTKPNDDNYATMSRPEIHYIKLYPKTGGGEGVWGRQVECGKGALPSDTQINIKGSTTEGRKEYTA
jgi:hypothetical protein